MKNIYISRLLAALCLLLWAQFRSSAQNTPCASTVPGGGDNAGSFFFNYGAASSRTLQFRTNWAIGPSLVGPQSSESYFGFFGYWSRFIAPPGAPTVTATQGDLLDRIQVSWNLDVLSTPPDQGFQIYRDGIFLAQVDKSVKSYNDFNVIAGRPYVYEVRGMNQFGNGASGTALGFQVPNGVVTGWVQTLNGNPVPDALVSLTPLQGFSLKVAAGQGAGADNVDLPGGSFLPTHPDSSWSLCFWVKTNAVTPNAGIITLPTQPLNNPVVPFNIRGAVGTQPGIAIDYGGVPLLEKAFDTPGTNGWQHVALTFTDGRYRLFVNGILVALKSGNELPATNNLFIGSLTGSNGWSGLLDELRIYHNVVLDELSLAMVMEGTASSFTPGLKYYWKMDEELGDKSFDVIKRRRMYFCDAKFDKDRPPVRTSGLTNEEGYYRIESANYGTGTTFLAKPMKDFYRHRALKFDRSESDYATLPDFPVTPKSTLELWVNSAGPEGEQTLLTKKWTGNDFRLLLREEGVNNRIFFQLNGAEADFGLLGNNYQHLSFTIESGGSSTVVTAYKNGNLIASSNLPAITGNWSSQGQLWVVGARPSGNSYTDYYGGLIDEIAIYDTTLAQTTIQTHANNSRDPQERGLRIYFSMDEGSGNRINNSGSYLSGFGTTFGTSWTPLAPNQMTTPHVFSPGTRQVTLNPSVTSVDQVDFTDRSVVPVSGFVRYKNTDCFAPNVEILINGASFNPRIFTDSTGKFTVDLEPGTTAVLSPVFEQHQFIPASWEVINVTSPIAGILFSDVTTRKIKVQVAGGDCKKSVLTPTTVCLVKVASLDECFVRTETMPYPDGKFDFNDLPPLEQMTVTVTEHSNPLIKTFFQVTGGATVDLTDRDTAINFIYYSPLQISLVSGLDTIPNCNPGIIVLNQDDLVTLTVSIVEQYEKIIDPMTNAITDDGMCPLDTGSISFINGFADVVFDTILSAPTLKYKFKVGGPNPSPPFLKTLQILGTSLAGRKGSLVKQGIVTGIRNKENTFTTQLPQVPLLVLRDPPGDGSYSYWEKNNSVCTTTKATLDFSTGGGGGVTIDNAPDVKIVAAPLGVGKIIEVDTKFGVGISGTVSYQKITDNSFETCVSVTERISTSEEELIVGQDADVFVGLGTNIAVGFADEVIFDPMTCKAKVKELITVEPLTPTTFMYSQFHIKNNIVRYLNTILANPTIQLDSATRAGYAKSVELWNSFLKDNASLKNKARFLKNLSFDAGVNYEFSETSDTTKTSSTEEYVNSEGEVRTFIATEIEGVGFEADLKFIFSTSSGEGKEEGKSSGITTGYVLKDNEPGDAFTVDIKMDDVHGTPVFRTLAGQSSCPWEDSTANREAPNLQLAAGSQFVANNVPANKPAFFNLELGNLSATNEDWTYGISAPITGNPNGAIIKLNGEPFDETQLVIVPYGKTVTVTVTVERGPKEYDYTGLRVALYSNCQFERNLALSLPLDNDPKFFSYIDFDVHFIRPCSEVQINVPEQNYVVLKNDPVQPGTLRRITVSGYNKGEDLFDRVRMQYRPADGDGAWLNITPLSDILKADLGPVFSQFLWETDGLPDGPYEIRAVALCAGDAADRPGYSDIIKIRIDREPPKLVGVPQPSDGVYQVGDEISFTFNQHVNCDKLIQDTRFPTLVKNNVGLYDATTNTLIDADVTCYENKIIIDPNFDNKFFENRVLRAELRNIEDLTGNVSSKFDWEFVVDRNELGWLTDSMGLTKFEDENKVGIASIQNRGGYPVPFKITGAPNWVRVVPSAGTLVANQVLPIRFEVDSTLAFGRWSDTITLVTETGQNPFFMGGSEPLPIGVRVVCRPPAWPFSPGIYENSMNMVLELNIQGEISKDEEDIVAAFIDDELRGKARVQYVPQLNRYMAYLSVYGDPSDQLKPVRFEIWDASECLRYGSVVESFSFKPDSVIGIPNNPQVIRTGGLILREVPFGFGWNWLSFNLAFPDNSPDAALVSLRYPDNDLLKGQSAFSVYSNGWFGSLTNLNNKTMYIYYADRPDTLFMLGDLINPATTNIQITPGWNWIGYIPNYSLPINAALGSLPSQTGDLIKGQLSFAQYIAGFGWIGNLKFLQPPQGYQIKTANAGTLTYPPPSQQLTGGNNGTNDRGKNPNANTAALEQQEPVSSFWTVNPSQFEYSMTLIGMLKANSVNVTTATMELGVFSGAELRGAAQAVYVAPLNAYLFFLTTYANKSGEQLRFKLFDSANGNVQDLTETMWFSADLHQGSLQEPIPFTLKTSSVSGDIIGEQAFEVQPNPFRDATMLRFSLPSAQEVNICIYNMNGAELSRIRTQARQGINTLMWDGTDVSGQRLSSGVYFVRLSTESGMVTKKVVIQR